MSKTTTPRPLIGFEYDCWKCPEWHANTAEGTAHAIRYGFARVALRVGRFRLVEPARLFWLRVNGGKK